MNEFYIYKGDVKIFNYRVFDTDGNPVSLLGYYIEVRVKDEKKKKIIIKKTTNDTNYIILNNNPEASKYGVTEDNEMAVLFESADTSNLDVQVYPFVIVIVIGDRQYTIYKNDLVVKGNYAV